MDKMVQIPAPLQNQNGEDSPWLFRFWGGAGVGWLIEKPPKEGGCRGQAFDIAVNSAVHSDCVAQKKSPAARQQIAFTCFIGMKKQFARRRTQRSFRVTKWHRNFRNFQGNQKSDQECIFSPKKQIRWPKNTSEKGGTMATQDAEWNSAS